MSKDGDIAYQQRRKKALWTLILAALLGLGAPLFAPAGDLVAPEVTELVDYPTPPSPLCLLLPDRPGIPNAVLPVVAVDLINDNPFGNQLAIMLLDNGNIGFQVDPFSTALLLLAGLWRKRKAGRD